jgi:glycosyltransferase involved in cell wall biosynthesis
MNMQGERLEILVSTMKGAFLRDPFKCQDKVLVIDQTDSEARLVEDDRSATRVYETGERGLSKSRNRALSLAEGDICLIADDDISLLPEYRERILAEFRAAPDADIITFQIRTPDGSYFKDNYEAQPKWHTLRSIMRVCSIEIAFRRDRVLKSGISFDERFGLGAAFPTGEEAIFLADAMRHGLKVRYVPVPIVVHGRESSGGAFARNPRLIRAKGAMFLRVFGIWGLPISLLFAVQKYKRAEMSFFHFVACLFKGMREYRTVSSR